MWAINLTSVRASTRWLAMEGLYKSLHCMLILYMSTIYHDLVSLSLSFLNHILLLCMTYLYSCFVLVYFFSCRELKREIIAVISNSRCMDNSLLVYTSHAWVVVGIYVVLCDNKQIIKYIHSYARIPGVVSGQDWLVERVTEVWCCLADDNDRFASHASQAKHHACCEKNQSNHILSYYNASLNIQ